ncbi:hypothetical protein niasHT_025025 [Heterodera trifolii]|uniref:Hexosyltransferase n=1 Tax=Heterodera trifolii TaxID=157864 RepID=A0ABD2KSW6_9BILA
MVTNRIVILLLFCITFFLVYDMFSNGNKSGQINVKEYKKADNWQETTTARKMGDELEKIEKNGTEKSEKRDEEDEQFEIRFKNIRLKYRMEFENECPDQTKLIILSMSRRDAFEKRKGIRQTWMKDAVKLNKTPNHLKLINWFWVPGETIRFLVADPSPGEAENVQQKLAEEQKRHGDLVFLYGFIDMYTNIHLKWYGGLQWQQSFCAGAEWVMKADDDSIVHLRRLAYWKENKFNKIAEQNPLVYFGHVFHNHSPFRNTRSKWFASMDMYAGDKYPEFVQGAVYLATAATIGAILSHSHEIVGFYLDDVVFTGILAELANVTVSDQRIHHVWGVNFDSDTGGCIGEVPTAFSMWGVESVKKYEYHYERLKSRKCTS